MGRMRKQLTIILLLMISFGSPLSLAESGGKPYRGKVFIGLGTRSVKLPKDQRYASTHGLEVTRVAAMSTAANVGLRIGDIVVSIDETTWTDENIRLSRSFGKVGTKSRPGDTARFRVLRAHPEKPEDPKKLLEMDVALLPYPFTAPETPQAPTNHGLRPDLRGWQPSYERLCRELVKACGYEAETVDLLDRIRRSQEYPDPHRLPVARYVHRDPFKLEVVTRELLGPLLGTPGSGAAEVPVFLLQVERMLLRFEAAGRKAPRPEVPVTDYPEFAERNLDAHLKYIEVVLGAAAECHRRAFAAFTPDEIAHVRKHRTGMLDSFISHHMLSYDRNAERQRASTEVIRLAKKVDVAYLIEQANIVTRLIAPEFTASLLKALEGSGRDLDTPVIIEHRTPHGPVLIAGRGRTRYQGKDYAAIYDLGGDDVYANNAASSIPGAIPSAVIVDYGGDDAYESTDPFRQGCGDMGVGMLLDLEGDDNYVGLSYTQAVGFMGVGVLCDESGDDTYRGIEYHQAVGHWGAGILIDRAGRDRYDSHDASQGVGLPGGCGLLCDAGTEGDAYYCKGKVPTGYGTPGVFEGWGQGLGTGYRPYASGGVGIVLDLGGADRFEAGNFSQGGGYFYGFGMFYNAGRDDDSYIGSAIQTVARPGT